MVEQKPRITAEELAALDAGRITQADLARSKGVSRATISRWTRKTPGAPVPYRTQLAPFWPWKVTTSHQRAAAYMRAFDHLRVRISGAELDDERTSKLIAWYRAIRANGEVLAYDPDAPPTAWRVKHGGFEYLEREPADKDLLIRVPDPEWWTEERRAAWKLPKDLPEG
ncbi:hypothetical protein FAB82_17375 [Glycomyces buryatensis]|uniref:Uncharacterized protein n=1 Tax=Glycomyces buryatensis TaxID=2570927 RepID=A0A4S8Q699_9ACTN|nr:hypothetical protein FAB82_17375 [Glycomyces buryatensis]